MLVGLRRLRLAAGLTLRQLAAAAEISESTLRAWENGRRRRPRIDLAFQMIWALNEALGRQVLFEELMGRLVARRDGPRRGRGE
jgi:transcriptional regulator with XRE-family HTH domain